MLKISYRIHDLIRRSLHIPVLLHIPASMCSKFYDIHYKYINYKLSNIFTMAYNKCKKDIVKRCDYKQHNSKVIWVFWWQGKNHMPELVKLCIKSIIQHSANHKVNFINKNNINKYITLPKYIYKKLRNHQMSLTNFSDVLRFNLLKKWGGLWIDSTVYCALNIPNKCFEDPLYTASGGYDKYHSNVSLGKWTSFLIGGNKQQLLFIFMSNFLNLYWKYNDYSLDYFLTDYGLNFAYMNNIGGFKRFIDNIHPKPIIFNAINYLNKPYNSKLFTQFIKESCLFKLSYKIHIKHNSKTFYNYLCDKTF